VLRQRGQGVAADHSRHCAAEQFAAWQNLQLSSLTRRAGAGCVTNTVGDHDLRYGCFGCKCREARFDRGVSYGYVD
jgi:hypothetical protein